MTSVPVAGPMRICPAGVCAGAVRQEHRGPGDGRGRGGPARWSARRREAPCPPTAPTCPRAVRLPAGRTASGDSVGDLEPDPMPPPRRVARASDRGQWCRPRSSGLTATGVTGRCGVADADDALLTMLRLRAASSPVECMSKSPIVRIPVRKQPGQANSSRGPLKGLLTVSGEIELGRAGLAARLVGNQSGRYRGRGPVRCLCGGGWPAARIGRRRVRRSRDESQHRYRGVRTALLMSRPERDDHDVSRGRKAVDSSPALGDHLRDE